MHIMVTGGAGFIGSHAAMRLLHDGHAVTAIVRAPPSAPLPSPVRLLDLLDVGVEFFPHSLVCWAHTGQSFARQPGRRACAGEARAVAIPLRGGGPGQPSGCMPAAESNPSIAFSSLIALSGDFPSSHSASSAPWCTERKPSPTLRCTDAAWHPPLRRLAPCSVGAGAASNISEHLPHQNGQASVVAAT